MIQDIKRFFFSSRKTILNCFARQRAQNDKTVRNVGRHYQADRKINSRVSKPDLQVTMAQNDINTFPRSTGEGLSAYDEILKRVQDDRVVSGAHRKHLFTYSLINLFTSKKVAFTLAEVLITLGIIGIVAAMTIPTLIAKYQEKQTVTRFKWVYSTLANAFTMAVAENGAPETWDLNSTEDLANILSKYMRISEKCHYTKGCLPGDIEDVSLSGETRFGHFGNYTTVVKEQFSNGITFVYSRVYKGCKYMSDTPDSDNEYLAENDCGNIIAFISPNKISRYGLDHFIFIVTPKGIFPFGYDYTDGGVKNTCNKNLNGGDTRSNGATCGEWIRRWNNADYWYD